MAISHIWLLKAAVNQYTFRVLGGGEIAFYFFHSVASENYTTGRREEEKSQTFQLFASTLKATNGVCLTFLLTIQKER